LRDESASGKSVEIIYCGDKDIISLNSRFKGKSSTTDVLAFDLKNSSQPAFLGEIYVNLQVARRQAAEYRVGYLEEVKRLTVHGILHLLGYRDESNTDRVKMWSRQESYL
jgi:probable rRNA maturation factor